MMVLEQESKYNFARKTQKYLLAHSYCKYHLMLNQALWEVPTDDLADQELIEVKPKMGEQLIEQLPVDFKQRNLGKFIAITFEGQIVAVKESLESLNEYLAHNEPTEDYYLARIGYNSIAQI